MFEGTVERFLILTRTAIVVACFSPNRDKPNIELQFSKQDVRT